MVTGDLVRQLARAGLPEREVARADGVNRRLRLTPEGRAAFLLDIRRTRVGNRVHEEFVIHPDHRPLRLQDWHRVVGNLEAPLPANTSWID